MVTARDPRNQQDEGFGPAEDPSRNGRDKHGISRQNRVHAAILKTPHGPAHMRFRNKSQTGLFHLRTVAR